MTTSMAWRVIGFKFLPTAALYYGAPAGAGRRAVCADSNGSAAGSCLADAVLLEC